MKIDNLEKAALQIEQQARHRINEANSWRAAFVLWALAFCAGAFVEGQQFHIIFEPYYVNDDGEIVGAKLWMFWANIISSMAITGLFIHFTLKWLLARAPATEEGIRALMGVLMLVAAVMTPFIIYATFSANPTTGEDSLGAHAVVLLRMPLVLGAVWMMGIAVLGMKVALHMKRDQERERRKQQDGREAMDNFALAWERERTQPQRIKDMDTELKLEVAAAIELACQIRGEFAIERASGKTANSFTLSVEEALSEALADYPVDIQRLVGAAMPPAIPYATLPATNALSEADREALIDHGMHMKSLSAGHVLKEMKKCA